MNRRKGVIVSYITLFVEVVSGILFTPFLLKMFGQSEYGIYGLVLNITSYMTLLDLGVGNSIVRYSAKYRIREEDENQKKLLGITILFYSIIAFIVLLFGVLISNNLTLFFSTGLNKIELERAKIMMMITFFNCALTMWLSSFNKIIIAYEYFTLSQVLIILRIILKVVILVPVLLLGGKGISAVSIDAILSVLIGIYSVYFVVCKLRLKPVFKNLDFTFIREIVSYSFFIFIQMVATQLNAMVDQLLIAALVPLSATLLAVYGLGAQICNYIQRIASAINGVLMPGVVKMVEQEADASELEREMVKIGRMIFAILVIIWINLLFFGRSFITIYAGKEYLEAYWVIIIISFPMILSLPQSIGTQILWAKNKHKIQAILKIIIAIVNIFLTILLIKWRPLLGACIGTSIALFLGDVVVMNIVFRRDIKINILNYYREMFRGIDKVICITLIVGCGLKYLEQPGIGSFLVNCICLTDVYLIVLYKLGLNDFESNFLKQIIGKKIKKKKNRGE